MGLFCQLTRPLDLLQIYFTVLLKENICQRLPSPFKLGIIGGTDERSCRAARNFEG